ncbi:MAG TPA: chemotaxis protein CheB [Candidatus Acidoferrales bacterium]|nr:chemotaxis protein CheB [Candidatus Acidoferrales bacterium]
MKSKSSRRAQPHKVPISRVDAPVERKNDLLIAAIGASAGGIEAFTEFVSSLPTDTGMAFVLVQHLDPEHHSLLTELLSKKTALPVREVTNGMKVEPNHVYVIPPNATMSISDHSLHLAPRGDSRGVHMSIDHFMRALAEQQGNRAIGVILSGSGTDGTVGLAEIQAHGGVTFAQDEASAKYDSMPRSAIASGCVDYVLPPKSIARELARIARHPYLVRDQLPESTELAPAENNGLSLVFQLLRKTTGVDFTHYRQTTILRRIQRRMVVHKMDKIEDYVKYVQSDPAEIKALYQDMLINVTSFFRNPHVFDALKANVFPQILRNHLPDTSIRIWTPGCASGEETYSVAIALLEFLGDRASQTHIQFFGTDVSESSIAKARTGLYPENILGDVSPERLRRFFSKIEGGYRISKNIRDMCIFAQHNILNDPPFSQMDLICCRNLLIYLEPVLQTKVISLFHYATRPGGYLVLGTSEGVGTATGLFSTEDRSHKIFLKKTTAGRQPVSFSRAQPGDRLEFGAMRVPSKPPESSWNYLEAQKEFDRRLLSQYSPATVFINEDLEIIHTRGSVNRYLKLSPGRASLSILKMAREGLLLDLRNAIGKAKKENVTVRKQNVQVKNGNGNGSPHPESTRYVTFEVAPIHVGTLREMYFMIVFFETPVVSSVAVSRRARRDVESGKSSVRFAKLEQELAATKEYLQSVIETQEATNEELQSANEEILSSNEELQSTNEELETAKEELQSANEELSTVNDELRNRNSEITQINNDLTNLFASIDIAVVMIGSDLSIRRFTPQAQKYLGLIPTDVGRPLLNINPIIEIPDFQALVLQVMSSLRPIDRELKDGQGGRLSLRILPYRTSENKIDGAVITIVDFLSSPDAPQP